MTLIESKFCVGHMLDYYCSGWINHIAKSVMSSICRFNYIFSRENVYRMWG